MMCTKLSMLSMYLRFFDKQKWFRLCDFTLAGFIVLYAIGSIFATVFQCTPVQRAWNKEFAGNCINLTAFWYANAVASVFSDLLIIALPMYPVYQLQITKRAKFLLSGVFLVGGM